MDLLTRYLHEGDHAPGVPVADVEHRTEQGLARVDQVVAEEDGEGLVADVAAGTEHRVAEAERLALADVMDAGQARGIAHGVEAYRVALGREDLLQLEGVVEVVLDGPLVAAGDHQDVVESGRGGLLDDVLDGRLVDDREHLLRRRLGRRQESGAEPGGRDDCLADRAGGDGGVRRVGDDHADHAASPG